MKVYEMNDYEWVASNLSAEETNEWYKNEFGLSDDDLDEPREVELDADGMWVEYQDAQHIQELNEKDITEVRAETNKSSLGDLWKRGGTWYIYATFREALKLSGFTPESEPMVIATTEW